MGGRGGGSFSIQKFIWQIFAIIDDTSVMNFGKNCNMIFRKWGGGDQRPFGTFPKIHPFWRCEASLISIHFIVEERLSGVFIFFLKRRGRRALLFPRSGRSHPQTALLSAPPWISSTWTSCSQHFIEETEETITIISSALSIYFNSPPEFPALPSLRQQ